MRIERLTEAYLPMVAELERCCFEEPWSVSALRLLLSDEATGTVCLSEDGKLLAYGGMLWAPEEGQMTNLAVFPTARRTGCGHAVLDNLILQAQQKGCTQISLEVRESNFAAISLYAHAGFLTVGRRKRFYRRPAEDALVMIRTLEINKKG